MIASQAVIAHLVGTWVEVRNENAGVVPTSTADNLAAGERIHPAELGTHGQFLINPPCLQRSMVCRRQVRANQSWPDTFTTTQWRDLCRALTFDLRIVVVHTPVKDAHFHPIESIAWGRSTIPGPACCVPKMPSTWTALSTVNGGLSDRLEEHAGPG
jgi:hypothetical protein